MISVIIPIYNGDKYIKRTLDSVLNQSYKDFEIIVVDDKSVDGSLELIENMAREYKKITVIRNRINSGFCVSANMGIEEAKGEFLIVLGQDDILEFNHMEQMIQKFDDAKVVGVYCDSHLIDSDGRYMNKDLIVKKNELTTRDFVKNNVMPSCGLLLKKDAVVAAGGYIEREEYPHYGEWDLWIRLLEIGRMVKCSNVKSNYRRHNNNLTNSFNDINKLFTLEKYWNMCRRRAIKSRCTPVNYKLIGILYYVKQLIVFNLKIIIRLVKRQNLVNRK